MRAGNLITRSLELAFLIAGMYRQHISAERHR